MSVVAPNISTKLVLVLPVASLVKVMMKASSEEALCLLIEMLRVTVETKVQLSKLCNVETCVVVAPPIVQKIKGAVEVCWKKARDSIFWLNVHEH